MMDPTERASSQTRLEMTKIDCFIRFHKVQALRARGGRIAVSVVISGLLMSTGLAAAQTSAPNPPSPAVSTSPATPPAAKSAPPAAPAPPKQLQENGYVIHQTADLGGHIVGVSGSGAMYDTLVNLQSGPRILGQTFTMHALPGTKHSLIDSLTADRK